MYVHREDCILLQIPGADRSRLQDKRTLKTKCSPCEPQGVAFGRNQRSIQQQVTRFTAVP